VRCVQTKYNASSIDMEGFLPEIFGTEKETWRTPGVKTGVLAAAIMMNFKAKNQVERRVLLPAID
jgi:hypothetical protein